MMLPHPIPYQGSKRKLAPTIAKYIPRRTTRLFEPFAGSAAMTIYVAFYGLAHEFVVGDSLKPMVDLLRRMVENPKPTADRYREIWEGQTRDNCAYFNEIRNRYNEQQDPLDLLYLICRCVKNAVRFNGNGRFTQSVDKRRLGMHPDKMQSAVIGVSRILRGRIEFRCGDWMETTVDATPSDFVYMDPPYLGTSIGRDKRYHQQILLDELVEGLWHLRNRCVPFALSYDGMTGEREYGPPLPCELGLVRLLLHAGTSSQSTLSGRNEQTIESLYVTPDLAQPVEGVLRLKSEQTELCV